MQIAIVGGGATGVLSALHLSRALRRQAAEIVVIEPAEVIGKGVAYATDDPRHLLNVRVANMGAFADQPDHLLQWLKREGPARGIAEPTPCCFISRGVYGAYLADIGQKLLISGAIRHVRERCINLTDTGHVVELALASGKKVLASLVVLATGNDTKHGLPGIPSVQPWAEGALNGLAADAPVLIIGSGLTMVDMVLSLDRRGHTGQITVLSPHGLLSNPHRPVEPSALAAEEVPFGAELSELTVWLRSLCQTIEREGGDWRSVMDALRPHTQCIWRAMSLIQRRRFLRHARSYWDLHRHRMAPEIAKQIAALRASGRLEIVAGRVIRARQEQDGTTAEIVRRGGGDIERRRFARLIDCTGLANDPRRSVNPLIRALLTSGAARTDLLGIGLDVSDDYALIDVRSRHSTRVRAIGPLARAAFWECIAIPDIRSQCQDLAEKIATSAVAGAPVSREVSAKPGSRRIRGARGVRLMRAATLRLFAIPAGLAVVFNASWQSARADGIDWSLAQLSPVGESPTPGVVMTPVFDTNAVSSFVAAWQARATQVRANQPAWSSPLITTTGMLEQRLRFDVSGQHAGNGANTTVIDGGRGLDLIVSNSNEIQIAAPPYDLRNAPTRNDLFSGFGDWAFLRVKQQLASAPASGGDYFVTVWVQVQAPTGIGPLTSRAWTYLPTLAVGKGWGDFDIQATVAAVLPASNIATLGEQIQTNIAFQYHLLKIFWPEFEVNWTYYVDGQRGGLNQIFLTPGLVIGRFQLTDGITFTTGVGYQVAVAPEYHPKPLTPAYSNAWVFTSRFNF